MLYSQSNSASEAKDCWVTTIMVKICCFVFFDIETTGLPHQERNKTKITEFSFVAALREDLEEAPAGSQPYLCKFSQLVNPEKLIHPEATKLTGLSNDMLKRAPTFKETIETILAYFNVLPKPVCLVAHNGNRFDYKILLSEFIDATATLPSDLYCVDSITGFKKIHKEMIGKSDSPTVTQIYRGDSFGSEGWPELDISKEDFSEIDALCSSFDSTPASPGSSKHNSPNTTKSSERDENHKVGFTLECLYKRLLKKDAVNAHRAENDCLMLLECVVAAKEFLPWADEFCKSIHNIKPLDRNRFSTKTNSSHL